MSKILVVDDAKMIHFLLRGVFEVDHVLISAFTLQEATELLRKEKFDLIILDVKLPDGDGFNFCASLQFFPNAKSVPVIFLTGQSDISDKSIGFSIGAEDYIVKPFNPAEVKLRCEVRLRKLQNSKDRETSLRFGDLRVDTTTQKVFLCSENGEEALNFTPIDFKLLYYLASHPDQVFSRQQLISAIWGEGTHIVDRTIDTHVGTIRAQLKRSNQKIQSVHGIGYRMTTAKSTPKKSAA